jgi:hypothetical protein
LQTAEKLTSGDRDRVYGPPIVNLTRFAELLTAYFDRHIEFTATDGAMIMALAKVSRVPASPDHNDNYVDGAAYFAIAGECAAKLAASKPLVSTQDR